MEYVYCEGACVEGGGMCEWEWGMCIVKVHVCGGSRVYSNSKCYKNYSMQVLQVSVFF